MARSVGGKGLGEQEALGEIAAEGLEPVELMLGFDPSAVVVRPRLRARSMTVVSSSESVSGNWIAVDELLVDLQPVDRQLAQVAQRGVTGAEVVDDERTPNARSSCSAATLASTSPISMVSVSSSVSTSRGRRRRPAPSATSAGNRAVAAASPRG